MAVIPSDRLQRIEFCEQHLAPWTASAAAIGLLPADVTALATRTTAARAAYNAAIAARQAAKAATEAFYNAVDGTGAMSDKVREMVKTIKAYADSKNDPNVYVLAQIPAPIPPVPGSSLPPGQPTGFGVALNPDGSITLSWKSTNAASSTGGSFVVARRFNPTVANPNPGFAVIGTAAGSGQSEAGGSRTITFTDATIPAGTTGVTYIVSPRRGGKFGIPSDAYAVTFGGVGLGLTLASSPSTGFSLAA